VPSYQRVSSKHALSNSDTKIDTNNLVVQVTATF
jgi:hypothetical protein